MSVPASTLQVQTGTGDGSGGVDTVYRESDDGRGGQSFTPSNSFRPTRVRLWLSDPSGGATVKGTLVLGIFTVDGSGFPDTEICRGSVALDLNNVAAPEATDIEVSSCTTLIGSTQYAVAAISYVADSGLDDEQVNARSNDSYGYSGGTALFHLTSWSSLHPDDWRMEIYGA